MKPTVGHTRDLSLVLILLTYGIIAVACTTPATAPTPTLVPTSTPGSTINAEATVASVEKARSPIAISTRTPAVVAMVEGRLEATKVATPTPTSIPTPISVPTPTPIPTQNPTATPIPTPVDTSIPYRSCKEQSRYTSHFKDNLNVSWEFDRTPETAGISKMYLRTSPSERENNTNGFGLLSLSQYEISDMSDLSYQYQLASPSAYQLALDIDLITEYQDGMACTSRMFSDLMYPEATTVEKRLTVPDGILVDYSRYADIVVPEPTVEALIFAFAEYKGGAAPSLQEIDYSIWKIYPEKTIEAYSPELRLYLFGEGVDHGDWESAAHMLEILSVITPELDPRFARDIDEVTLPQFHMFCESWMVPQYKKHCNMTGNAAAFSNGPTRHYVNTRGFLWFQSRIVTEPREGKDEKIGDIATNPCCSINFHEFSHSVGLNHNYCPHSSVGRWEDRNFMTKPFSEDDLAGMAVHLDPRTEHGMTLEEAADALGIDKNERYYELVEKPWLACGEQHPTWEEWADRIYEDHISSDLVETNHPR